MSEDYWEASAEPGAVREANKKQQTNFLAIEVG